jgi:predicted RNA-binding Zn-ribbon protein involved in translation (DUF1610 family)
MTCPRCGSEMNHQADKLVQPLTDAQAASLTPLFDGIVESVFACPGCGWIDSCRGTGAGAQTAS